MSVFPTRRALPIVLAVATLTFDFLMLEKVPLEQAINEYQHLVEENLPTMWHYLEHLPAPDEPWPQQASAISNLADRMQALKKISKADEGATLTLTTGIPGLYPNVEKYFPELLRSIASQIVPAEEVVVVISQVVDREYGIAGNNLCENIYIWMHSRLQYYHHHQYHRNTIIRLILLCVGERLTAGRARNAVGHLATSDIVSFIDMDDLELPLRNAVTKEQFSCHPDRKMVLHQYASNSAEVERILQHLPLKKEQHISVTPRNKSGLSCVSRKDVVDGSRLYDIMQQTHERWWLRKELAHGHMVVHHSVLEHVQFSSLYKGEDAAFVRDVLTQYGRHNDQAVVYLQQALTTYFKSNQANKDLLQ